MTTIGIIGAGGIAVVAVSLKLRNNIPAKELAGKIMLDTTAGLPSGTPGRLALSASSDLPEAVELVARLYDEFGFDFVDNSPLSESWRSGPGQPARNVHEHQDRATLATDLAGAVQHISRTG